MYAVVRVAGTQHIVKEGDVLLIPHQQAEPGTTLIFEDILALHSDKRFTVGQPRIPGATVEAVVVEHPRLPKVTTIKFIRRENYRRRKGHRQQVTKVRITSIKTG